MNKYIIYILLFLLSGNILSAQDNYFFGENSQFDSKIPSPEKFFGFPIGSSLARYDKVVEYYKLLAQLSDRANLEVIGNTYENREQVVLIVSSPNNQKNIESIRKSHLKLVDPKAPAPDLKNEKVIVHLGYNVHGGEIAGTESAILAAYYFVATNDAETLKQLEETVILIEPSLNPDGRDRAASYLNTFKSVPPVTDPADREHAGGFIPHRGNHFWTDLNRDWLSLVHVESKARVKFYHEWYPNIYADYHEMGSNNSYYFEPSPPRSTWNPTIPTATYEVLNNTLAKYYSQALDQIGSLYYTKEDFDNIAPIYGSTYPDFHGGVGTTLEVGSSAGIEIETSTGIRKFSQNIKDNLLTSIAAVKAAVTEKQLLLKHQKDFYTDALKLADKGADKFIVFGDKKDKNLTNLFLQHLLEHQINAYELPHKYVQGNKEFEPGSAYVVPYAQGEYRILNAIFEENTQFVDSIFMDITAWSTAHGYGIPFVKAKGAVDHGSQIKEIPVLTGNVSQKSDYAYIFSFNDYLASKALYYLLDKGVIAKVAYKDFSTKVGEKVYDFNKGAVVIPVKYQKLPSDDIYKIVQEAASLTHIDVIGVTSGFSVSGIDLGSNNIRTVNKPVVTTFTGEGIDWTNVGENWFLLGNRLNIPLSKIDIKNASQTNLNRYTAIILSNGDYKSLTAKFIVQLQQWIENGGTLITIGGASEWAISQKLVNGFASDTLSLSKEKLKRLDYTSQRENEGPQRIGGAIFKADLDLTNPLSFGLSQREFYAIKSGNFLLPPVKNSYASVLQLTEKPQISGYVSKSNQEKLKNLSLVVFEKRGQGTVVLFSESPTFRGYWLSTGRILTNALFFGNNLSLGGRYRP